jgi:hypothetical protein
MDRRSFIRGVGAGIILGAPAVVSASSLMKIWVPRQTNFYEGWDFSSLTTQKIRTLGISEELLTGELVPWHIPYFETELTKQLHKNLGGKPNTQETRSRVVDFISCV